jgi:hypothetical protein
VYCVEFSKVEISKFVKSSYSTDSNQGHLYNDNAKVLILGVRNGGLKAKDINGIFKKASLKDVLRKYQIHFVDCIALLLVLISRTILLKNHLVLRSFKMEEELLEYYSYLKKVKNFKEKLPQLFNENGGE